MVGAQLAVVPWLCAIVRHMLYLEGLQQGGAADGGRGPLGAAAPAPAGPAKVAAVGGAEGLPVGPMEPVQSPLPLPSLAPSVCAEDLASWRSFLVHQMQVSGVNGAGGGGQWRQRQPGYVTLCTYMGNAPPTKPTGLWPPVRLLPPQAIPFVAANVAMAMTTHLAPGPKRPVTHVSGEGGWVLGRGRGRQYGTHCWDL